MLKNKKHANGNGGNGIKIYVVGKHKQNYTNQLYLLCLMNGFVTFGNILLCQTVNRKSVDKIAFDKKKK